MDREGNAARLARDILGAYGASGWTVHLDQSAEATGRGGLCDFDARRVLLSAWHVSQASWREVVRTVRHEVAHALAFEFDGDDGHGPAWEKWHKRLGA